MLRLSIITASYIDTLMVSAALTFQEEFQIKKAEELNKVFQITEEFVSRIGQMKTCLGFCETKRSLLAKHLKDELGKNAIITTKWLSTTNTSNSDYLRKIVNNLNTNQSLTIPQSNLLKSYGIQINP